MDRVHRVNFGGSSPKRNRQVESPTLNDTRSKRAMYCAVTHALYDIEVGRTGNPYYPLCGYVICSPSLHWGIAGEFAETRVDQGDSGNRDVITSMPLTSFQCSTASMTAENDTLSSNRKVTNHTAIQILAAAERAWMRRIDELRHGDRPNAMSYVEPEMIDAQAPALLLEDPHEWHNCYE